MRCTGGPRKHCSHEKSLGFAPEGGQINMEKRLDTPSLKPLIKLFQILSVLRKNEGRLLLYSCSRTLDITVL